MCDIGKIEKIHMNVPKPKAIPISVPDQPIHVEPIKIPVKIVVRK